MNVVGFRPRGEEDAIDSDGEKTLEATESAGEMRLGQLYTLFASSGMLSD